MPYYLHHYFDPFFNHTKLAPAVESRGRVDHHCLEYVQNVVAGQVIAELIPIAEDSDVIDTRFLQDTPTLPAGPNTLVNPENEKQLLAARHGYVFYHEGLISIKKLLNIRGPVDFHTGNVIFINDLCVEGVVKTGFELQARNILTKDIIEGANIRALNDFIAEQGIKGAKSALIDAGGNIRAAFCENCELRSGRDILIQGSALHSQISVNGSLIVKGRFQGGKVYANNMVYIEEQLGGGINTPTSIIMGYPPSLLLKLEDIEEKITVTEAKIDQLRVISAKSELHKEENLQSLSLEQRRLAALRREQQRIMKLMRKNANSELCRVVVPGTIRPGVEISIGRHYTKINDYLENVTISLRDGEMCFDSPATIKK